MPFSWSTSQPNKLISKKSCITRIFGVLIHYVNMVDFVVGCAHSVSPWPIPWHNKSKLFYLVNFNRNNSLVFGDRQWKVFVVVMRLDVKNIFIFSGGVIDRKFSYSHYILCCAKLFSNILRWGGKTRSGLKIPYLNQISSWV